MKPSNVTVFGYVIKQMMNNWKEYDLVITPPRAQDRQVDIKVNMINERMFGKKKSDILQITGTMTFERLH